MTETKPAERGANVHVPPPAVFAGLTLLGIVLRYAIGPIPFPTGPLVRLLGAAVLLVGLAIVASARVRFVRTGRSPIPWKPTPELIFSGPYRFTRNPMYVGVTYVQIGIGMAFGNAWIVLLAPVALAIIHVIAVLPEEAYLAQKFGQSYQQYRAKVRRYL